MSKKCHYTREARKKNGIFGAFLTDFPPKTVIFSKNLQNFRVFEKNSRALGKNSSFLASKLNKLYPLP